MRCSKAQKWISRRVDGVLDGTRGTRLDDHLERCGECRAYARALARLGFDQFDVPDPTLDFAGRIARRLDSVSKQRRPVLTRPRVFRPVAAGLGAAAAMVGFSVGSFLRLADRTDTPPNYGTVELTVSDAIDPSAEDSVESVLIAMISNGEE